MKNLSPLHLPELDTIPLSPQDGFYKIYLRGGVVYKLDANGVETPIGNFIETEPLFTSSPAYSITIGNISQWNTAYGWGDHASAGYITTESDPVFQASPAYGITNNIINQWNAAYNWGDHAVQGYLKQADASLLFAALNHTHTFAQITNKPTSLVGYGITDPVVLTSNSYSDPSWIAALSWSKITGAPTFVTALSALTDVQLSALSNEQLLRYNNGKWSNWTPNFLTPSLADTLYISFALRGAANGVASLNALGQVPATQLPSYVDDVLEFSSPAAFPNPGETGKIYVALNTNETYRWTGSGYTKIVGGEVQSVNLKTGNVILTTDDIAEGLTNLYFTNARVKSYADTLYPSLTGSYNNPSWINQLSWNKIIDVPAYLTSTGTTNYITKWAANGALVNSIIFENGGVGINTNAVNAQAMLHVMGNNVRTKSLTLDSTWNYQTSFNIKNGVYSAEFNLGGSTKSTNEGGPGSLQVSTYNATTGQFRYPITFFGNGNVGFAGQLGSVPADNGSTLQVTGTIQQSSVTSAMLKANAAGQLVAAIPDVDYVVNVPTPTLQFVTGAGNTTSNRIIFNTATTGSNYPIAINDNTNAFIALNVVNTTGARAGGIRFQSAGVDRNVLLFNENGNVVITRYNSGVYAGDIVSFFNATGNVGIGTSTDIGYRLDVFGIARMKGADTTSAQALRVENSDASYYYNFQNNGYLVMNGFLSVPVIDQSSLNIRSNNLLIGGTGSTVARVQISGSVNASGGAARGLYLNTAEVAAANNDTLVAMDIDSSFANGAFTGVTNIALRTMSGEVRHLGLPNQTSASMMYYDQATGRLSYGAAPATPTLQSVTNAGNTTTNAITVGGLSINNNTINSQISVESNRGTGASNFVSVNFRNINSTSNKTQFTIGGGTIASGESRTFSFGTDINGAGIKDFYIYNGATNNATFLITPSDNVRIGYTGISYTDAGFKLDVSGTLRATGTITGDFTNGFALSSGVLSIKRVSSPMLGVEFASTSYPMGFGFRRSTIVASGHANGLYLYDTISFQSGTNHSYTQLDINPTIQQYLGASPTSVVRGIHIRPVISTFTTTPYRAIEWDNNIGHGLYGSGTAPNYLNGNLLIGTTTDSGHKLRVQGTVSAVLTNATHNSQVYYNTTTGELTYGAYVVPTLDSVTASGNTTTNSISVGGLTVDTNLLVVDGVNNKVGIGITNPTYGFEVAGIAGAAVTAKFSSTGSARNTVYIVGNGTTSNVSGAGIFLGNSEGSLQVSLSTHSFHFGTGIVGAVLQSTGAIALAQGTTERLRIAPDTGNVLIGTVTDSTYKLDVNGTFRTTADTYLATTSGNVGIGTTSPGFKTTITADITKDNNVTPGTAHLSLEGATTPGKRMILGYDITGNGFGFIKAGNYGVAWTNLSLQPDGGNVGVGITAPIQKFQVGTGSALIGTVDTYGDVHTRLYVHSTTGAVNIVLNPRPTAADVFYRVKIGVDVNSNGSFYVDHEGAGRIIESWQSGTYLNLPSVVSLGNKAWTLETNGYGLQMYSPFGWSSVVRFTNAGTGTAATNGALVGLIEGGQFKVWTYENQPMIFGTTNNEQMRITSVGNVGIGTMSPTVKLDVAGTGKFQGLYVEDTAVGLSSSALLQLNSTTKGFLAPRMTTTQRNAVSGPATGLMVFDTTVGRVSTYSGTNWEVFARELERRYDYDSVVDTMYIGKAISGSAESASVWKITKIVTLSSGDVTVTTATNVAWTDRLSATYS